jgi:hypothetical protein
MGSGRPAHYFVLRTNEYDAVLFVDGVHDRSTELAPTRIGRSSFRCGRSTLANASPSGQANGGSSMTKTGYVALLGFHKHSAHRVLYLYLDSDHRAVVKLREDFEGKGNEARELV